MKEMTKRGDDILLENLTISGETVLEKIKDNQQQLKELKIALSDYLSQYVKLSGTNQIEGPDGVVRQIIYTAKLVKSK